MSNEGRLWKARWKKIGRRFRTFLNSNPEVFGLGETLDDAIARLEDEVIERLDDPVPHFEWLNALPTPQGLPERDFIFVLAGHHGIDVPDVDSLLENPRCARCHNYSGIRTSTPIRLDGAPDGDAPFTQFDAQLCSARLVQFLKLDECREIQLLPIVIDGGKSTPYFELRSNVVRPFVAKKGVACRSAFQCQECGSSVIAYLQDEAEYFQFVARSALPEPLLPVITLGTRNNVELAISHQLRRKIVTSNLFKNVRSRRVGILNEEQVITPEKFFAGVTK